MACLLPIQLIFRHLLPSLNPDQDSSSIYFTGPYKEDYRQVADPKNPDILFQSSLRLPGLFIERLRRQGGFSMVQQHFHRELEVYYQVEGRRQYFVDRRSFLSEAGTLVCIRPGSIHMTQPAGPEAVNDRLLLNISSRFPLQAEALLPRAEIAVLFKQPFMLLALKDSDRLFLDGLTARFTDLTQQDALNAQGEAVCLTLALLRFLMTRSQERLPAEVFQTGPRQQKVYEAIRILEKEAALNLSLDQLAARLFISKFHLCRAFKEVTGMTVKGYSSAVRIRQASELLLDPQYSIAQVASQLGFSSLTQFERVFRRLAGQTPRDYRAERRQGQLDRP